MAAAFRVPSHQPVAWQAFRSLPAAAPLPRRPTRRKASKCMLALGYDGLTLQLGRLPASPQGSCCCSLSWLRAIPNFEIGGLCRVADARA